MVMHVLIQPDFQARIVCVLSETPNHTFWLSINYAAALIYQISLNERIPNTCHGARCTGS